MAEPVTQPQPDHTPTRDEALANAARLLRWAEAETDLTRMERLTELGNSWLTLAAVLDGNDPI